MIGKKKKGHIKALYLIAISLVVLFISVALLIGVSYLKQTTNVEDCYGDVCIGNIRMMPVYTNADNKYLCNIVGGKYEERYNGWGGYNIYCLAK